MAVDVDLIIKNIIWSKDGIKIIVELNVKNIKERNEKKCKENNIRNPSICACECEWLKI